MKAIALVLVMLTVAVAIPVWAGDITGKVSFTGPPPKPVKLLMGADPICMRQQKGTAYSEEVIVNPNATLRNVLVYVKDGLTEKSFPPANQKAVLDQDGCRYKPHVLGMQTGQEVVITNEDNTLHNVHSLSKINPAFNAAQPNKGVNTLRKKFDAEEIFKVKCEVHPWMGAYIGVFPHPFYAVTGDDGTFSLKKLPAGEYTLEAWHEKYGTRTIKVKVEKSGTAAANFTYGGR